MFVSLLAAAALATAPAPPPPDDVRPLWSPDARYLLFRHEAAGQPSEARIVSVGRGSLVLRATGVARGWTADDAFGVARGSSTSVRTLANALVGGVASTDVTWTTDGTRSAYVWQGGIWVGDVTGGHAVRISDAPAHWSTWDVTGLAWSKDGTKLAYTEESADALTSSIRVIDVASGSVRTVFSGPNANVNPSFSPDGTQLAFETNAGTRWRVMLAGVDGSNLHALESGNWHDRLPTWSNVGPQLLVVSDRSNIPSPAGQTAYDVWLITPDHSVRDTRMAYDVNPLYPAAWSPTGAQIAYSAGRECLRWGVYVENVATRKERRLSNICHFEGTSGVDKLSATAYRDFMQGLAGNDTLHGGAGNDKLEGNNGNDVLYGDAGNDAIFGGPGNDRISGGAGNDSIVGGPGHDVIDCGPGIDTVVATRLDTVRNCEKRG